MSVTWAPRARIIVKASWPGCVEEDDPSLGEVDSVGADVLRDSAVFPLRDVRAADGIQELRLAVVDVPHDGDDGRPGPQVFLLLLFLLDHRLVVEGDRR